MTTPNTMTCDTPTALRFLASAANASEAEWMLKAADDIERLAGIAAFSSPDMVKWLTDQVMQRENVIDAMKKAGMEQITKAFTERRWIPVTERLPEDNVDVLVRRKTDCGMRSVAAYRSSGRDCWTITDGDYSEFYDHSVTHWMPLPEPPEVK